MARQHFNQHDRSLKMTPAEMINKYIALRNKLTALKEQHKQELAPFTDVMSQLENQLLDYLNTNDLQSANGAGGTVYKAVMTSVTVKEWQRTLEYIKTNEAWDLLEARVSKTGALAVREETKNDIPGVQVTQSLVVRVRTT
jgi:hypothetical protein